MTIDHGRSASPSGHSRAEPEEVSALRASVPNADEKRRAATLAWIERQRDREIIRNIIARRKSERNEA